MMTSLRRSGRGYREAVDLDAEIAAAAVRARALADADEELVGVIPAEPEGGVRVYLCAYGAGDARRWLALDASGTPIVDRRAVRDAVAIAAMCELAEESAGGGDVGDLRARLVELRLTENPEGIDEAEVAAAELQEILAASPRVASVAYLDAIGVAAARLEQALGGGGSPFAEAMKLATGAVEALVEEVEDGYKRKLA